MDKYQNKYRIQTARAVWHDYDGGAYFVTICTAGRAYYFGEIRNGEMILSGIGKIAEAVFTNVSEYYPYAEIPLFVIMPNHVHAIVFIDDYCRDHAAKHCERECGQDCGHDNGNDCGRECEHDNGNDNGNDNGHNYGRNYGHDNGHDCRDAINRVSTGSMGPMGSMGAVERSMEHPVKRSQAMSETVDNTSGMDTNIGIRLSKGGITGNKNPMVSKILGTVIRGVKARVSHLARHNGNHFSWQSRYYDRIIRNDKEMNRVAEYIENNIARWDMEELNETE